MYDELFHIGPTELWNHSHESLLLPEIQLKMCGVTDLEIGWSWFFSFLILHIFTALFVTLVSMSLFPKSNFLLLLIFWELCFLGFIVLSLLISTMTAKSTRGVLIGLLVVFGGYFLTLAANYETGSAAVISLISLHPVAAMSYGLSEIGRLESLGVGVTWSSITTTDSPSGYTFASTFGNLIFSSLFLGLFTWYLNRTIAPDYGQALPVYFPFTSAYWCPHSVKHEEFKGTEDNTTDDSTPIEPVSDALKQQTRDGESIEIRSLRKDFGEKVAVDGLDLSMYNGQITALLGHNGGRASKSFALGSCALSCV
jgi:ATP-binding cassette, subfamily A (ABC1), member 3